jgi:hypothetical protein
MPPPARINAGISPRIIQISLSGSDRKAQAKASALHNSQLHESHLIRSTTEAKICDADLGHDAEPAEELLRLFERTLAIFESDLAELGCVLIKSAAKSRRA